MISDKSRLIAHNTIMLYVRMLLNMGITIYTSRVVLNVLGVDNFGVFNLVGGVIAMFTFVNGALVISTQRFVTFDLGRADIPRLRQTFSVSMIVHILLATGILILGETVGLWIVAEKLKIPDQSFTAAMWVYQFSIISAMVDITQVPYSACITAHEKMGVYAYFAILNNVLRLVIVWLLLIMRGDKLIIYSALGLGVSILMQLLYRLYCSRKFPECKFSWVWRPALMRQMASFSAWSLIGNCAGMARYTLTPVLVNLFYGVMVNAAIGIATTVSSAIGIFSAHLINAMRPQIVKSYAAGESAYSVRLMMSGSRLVAILVLFVGIPFFIETGFVLRVWLKLVPEYSVWLVRLSLAFLFFNMLSYLVTTGVHATGDIRRPNLISGILGVSVLLISWVMLKYCHVSPYFPYFLFVITCFLSLCVDVQTVGKHMQGITVGQYLFKVLLLAIFVGVLATLMAWLGTRFLSEGWGRLLLCAGISCTATAILAWFFVFQALEKNLIRTATRSILVRLHLSGS